MLKTKNGFTVAALAFIAAEAVLGISLQLASGILGRLLSFSAVLLAAGFAALLFEKSKTYILTQLALVFTVCADVFLVLCDPQAPIVGMIFFSGVQVFYFLRIYFSTESEKIKNVHLSVRIAVLIAAAAVTVAVLRDSVDALSMISVLYFANLILNIVFSFASGKINPVFSVGLVLFLLCDVFIGFSMIEAYIPLTEGTFFYWLAYPGLNFAWMFYVPAQTLLALSIFKAEF